MANKSGLDELKLLKPKLNKKKPKKTPTKKRYRAPEGESKLSPEVKAIKSANRRIKEIAEKFGTDSDIYKSTIAFYSSSKFDGYINYSKGVLQISTKLVSPNPKVAYNKSDKAFVLGVIKRTPTLTSIYKETAQALGVNEKEFNKQKREEKIRATNIVREVSGQIQPLINSLYDAIGQSSVMVEFPELKDGKMSYEESIKFIEKAHHTLKVHKEYTDLMDVLNTLKLNGSITIQDIKSIDGMTIPFPKTQEKEQIIKAIKQFMKDRGLEKPASPI